ncbi:MAG: binding-protein-dependent transport system inner rane component [Glaciihabitans sp.]|jgi:raffinose/stachyose/melibiose transport system permease protein|nr:binding-protein-dependent transport system inner rane component [Glaciihabitans sp.]MDQ1555498.1 raffinose/stachyose/melibiose transport system permease protein [Actinomycetota bacterium]
MRTLKKSWVGIVAILISIPVFLVPFAFIILTAMKGKLDAADLGFTWPKKIELWDNIVGVVQARDGQALVAFINSTVLTVASVTLLVILASMVAFVLQRRPSRWNGLINFLVLSGLIIPPAVVPTITVLQGLQLFGTLPGLILIEVAFGMSFCVLLFRAFLATIPREVDEAAIIDGAGTLRLFFQVIFPLLRSVVITVIVVQSVVIFNDFTNPLYFLPGDANATVQLTLFNFQSEFNTSWNLLFTDILLITIPPLVMFLFFNRQIVAGLASGSVKG